jgi:hypothetical protein
VYSLIPSDIVDQIPKQVSLVLVSLGCLVCDREGEKCLELTPCLVLCFSSVVVVYLSLSSNTSSAQCIYATHGIWFLISILGKSKRFSGTAVFLCGSLSWAVVVH